MISRRIVHFLSSVALLLGVYPVMRSGTSIYPVPCGQIKLN